MAYLDRYAYLNKTINVNPGATNQSYDVRGALVTAGAPAGSPGACSAHHVEISTDVNITFRFNATTADEVTLAAGTPFILEAGDFGVHTIYWSHTGASSGSGAATVTLWAD